MARRGSRCAQPIAMKALSQLHWCGYRRGAALVQLPASLSWSTAAARSRGRRYEVDFDAKRAVAHKGNDHWDQSIGVEPGRTFAGIGFALAVSQLLPRLRAGEKIDLEAIALLPRPRTSGVEVSLRGETTLRRAGKSLAVVEVVIHPKVPWPVSMFIHPKDVHLFFYKDDPPQLLRAIQPLVEVGDPVVQIDVLPGGKRLSKPAARR